ncbi:MAG: hypothetical protein IJ557_02445 [Bacteroidaceae bacterium]|nr:hypothetical protein [Bacteroidaceae bacterium]
MNAAEREAWLFQFSKFLLNDYNNIKQQGIGWRQSFDRGLEVLQPMTICTSFVVASRQRQDYTRRITRMSYFVEELRKQVIAAEGSLLVRMSEESKPRRVGRPTKEESLAKTEQSKTDTPEKKRALGVVAGLASEVTSIEHHSNSNPSSKEETMENKQSEAPAPINNTPKTTPNPCERPSHLQDVKHLLSPDLQAAVDSVAMLRSRAATESTIAKDLASQGASAEEIAKHAKIAAQCTDAYTGIYARVDEELAARKDPKGGNPAESVEADKASIQQETDLFAMQERSEILHQYRTYFIRKDIKPSAKRLEKMQGIISELKQWGVDTAEYETIYASEELKLTEGSYD